MKTQKAETTETSTITPATRSIFSASGGQTSSATPTEIKSITNKPLEITNLPEVDEK